MKKENIMANRKRWLIVLMLALVAVLSFGAFAACSGVTYAITWNVSENATVTVADYDELPAEVAEGTTLSFTVAADTGYEIDSVRANDRTVRADGDGNYSVTVNAETTIEVTTIEQVSSVAVTTNPTTMTYYAGEKVDTAGMVVEVTYGSGRTATETDYSIVYEHGSAFTLGDTSFSVRFRGVESDPVQLTVPVEVKVTIDPAGGEISSDYIAALEANDELNMVAQDEDNVITFSYSELTENVALPTEEQWTRGTEGDYIFTGWSNGATEISADNDVSVEYVANYKPVLLALESIYYEVDGDVPYLVISGTFRAAQTAYLYLYEGNDKVELKGDTVGDENTQRGDPFELKFDMRKLVEANYLGKWMDIKFVAGEGESAETQEILLSDYPEDFVDTEQIIVVGDYAYSFATYNGLLKALYTNYFMNEYTLSGSQDAEGNAVLTIDGKVDASKYAGKTVRIDFTSCVSPDDVQYCVIGADGSYSVSFNFANYSLNTDGYCHFSIVESEEDPTVVYKDGDGNLLNAGCINDNLETVNIGLIENQKALRISNADGTKVSYVGLGKWGGIVYRAQNEAVKTEGVTLETYDGKPCLAIKGSYVDELGTPEDVIAYLTQTLYADIQNNADSGSGSGSTNPDWGSATVLSLGDAETPATIFVTAADNEWTVYLDLSARQNTVGEWLFFHYGNSGTNLTSNNIDTDAVITATVGETTVQYRLGVFTGWSSNLVTVYVEAAE